VFIDSWFGVVRNREKGPKYLLRVFPRRDENGVPWREKAAPKKKKVKA
jgi:hypothetical protein